jgi:phosphoribosyl-ATP pyrophosphohydrolase
MAKATGRAAPQKRKKKAASPKAAPQKRKKKVASQKATKVIPAAPADALHGSRADARVLDKLWTVVMTRRTADTAVSHSARLLARGTAKVAQKFGEEAVECLIEAVAGNKPALITESADVLYHLLVLWVDAGLRPDEVWEELHRREGVSGLAEKASRGSAQPLLVVNTRKIP